VYELQSGSARNQEPPSRGAVNSLTLGSGLQLDLEIALGGGQRRSGHLRPIHPCRRCVETSDDV